MDAIPAAVRAVSRLGGARSGEARRGPAGRGSVRMPGCAYCNLRGELRRGKAGRILARHDRTAVRRGFGGCRDTGSERSAARPAGLLCGEVLSGRTSCGSARSGVEASCGVARRSWLAEQDPGKVMLGAARRDRARRGVAWPGLDSGFGVARPGMASLGGVRRGRATNFHLWSGEAWRGLARHGLERPGLVRQGEECWSPLLLRVRKGWALLGMAR